jgi:hydrogenase-4 membrane subunit HyfE
MGCEQLRGCCLFIALQSTLLALFGFRIGFSIRDIELIKPSEQLHVLAVLIRHAIANVRYETLVAQ